MPVRRALAALLALPVLVAIYLPLALRRGPATRMVLALAIGGLVLAAAVGIPGGAVGVPTATQTALAASALGPAVSTARSLTSALLVDFDAPMDAASVAGAIRVEPAADVTLGWSADGRRLSIVPVGTWRPATLYTVTVGAAARDRQGRALASPLRAGFLTRALTGARLAATDQRRAGVALDSAVVISFDRPVAIAAVLRAFRISPPVPGQLLVATDGPDGGDPTMADSYVWQPLESFAGNTRYTVELGPGVVDEEGAPIAAPQRLAFRTGTAPSVVRFRPLAGTQGVSRGVPVSVRFTMPMDRASTAAAFSVVVNGKQVPGTVEFAENDKVLVFAPKAAFPFGAAVTLRVTPAALSAGGAALDRGRAARFTVVAKAKPAPKPAPAAKATAAASRPAPKPTPKPAAKPVPVSRPASSSWLAAEKYLLALTNCTRGGGWVLYDGTCSSPGGSGIAPLKLDAGISARVSRPYAKRLVMANSCTHFLGGTPGDRLRAAGYTSYHWAENIGCHYQSNVFQEAIDLVRFYQNERPYNGGHWVNMMNRDYDRAGVGLWVSGGRLFYVIDFYRP